MGSVETFKSLEDFNACLQQYEEDTNTKFIVLKSDRAFGKNDLTVEKQLQWEVKIVPFNGVPFKIIGKKTYICHQGRDKHAKAKQRRQESKAQGHEYSCLKTKRLMQQTKKMGCPATINVVHIVKFPEYKDSRDIWNIIKKIKAGNRKSSADHHNLQALVNTWKEEGCAVEYRPSQEEEDGSVVKMLLCLQTPWQRRLMLLYGQHMCLLEETCRAGRNSLPLFFLCVRTNVSYAVVGVFVTQTETKEDIAEALKVFQKWNSDWNPSQFIVDFCEAEISALEEVFKGSKVLLCDVHREKAWMEWTRKKDNGVASQEEVLKLLQAIADSQTNEEFENKTVILQQHPDWQSNEKLRRFVSTWLLHAEKWVNVFGNENLNVAAFKNKGVEIQKDVLKHSYLKGHRNCSLSETLVTIMRDFLPRSYQKYVELNVKCSNGSRKYSTNVPCYVRERPRIMALHIMKRHQKSLLYSASDITSAGENIFIVQSQTSQEKHQVNFGKDDEMPSCTCMDWRRHLLPCQHFCAVFTLVPGWSWENLSAVYRNNPLFTFDEVCLGQFATLPADLQGKEVLKKNQENDTNLETTRESCTSSPERCPSPAAPSETFLTTPKAEKREKCGTLLKEISELTCHIQDGTFLDSVTNRLSYLLEDIRQHTPHDDILDLSYAPPSKKMCSASTGHPKTLPIPKRCCVSVDEGNPYK
ncbi:uncharacterized protein LOC131523397 isoform X2 [Onychostoma macrolepis]|uniref:uncharacterized protein LOC131523397 isoform X2 n=1 Tax=Onychostoma macrolepis TaxID=369639 RepID=UPI00272A30E0|nr:uncharacterized protein LOC131523397 isoform X2 [Onychostoma macrolepis]